MKKVLLISPPFKRLFGEGAGLRGVQTPLGLCSLAAILEKNGFEAKVYNADFTETPKVLSSKGFTDRYEHYLRAQKNLNQPLWAEISRKIKECSPDIVGITATTPMLNSAFNVAKIVKSFNPRVPVVLGGAHPTIMPEETIHNANVDIVVRGEGELTFLEILKNYDRRQAIQGVTYKKNGCISHNPDRPLVADLDDLPFPARHLIFDYEKYPPEAFGNIFASRGCPFNCLFCASRKIWGKKVRYRSPENVTSELLHIKKNFHANFFRFEDDSFTLNRKWVLRLCELMVEKRLNIKWMAETRADVVDDSLINKMKLAGCKMLDIGVESGNERTLQRLQKGITLQQARKAFAIIKSNKILTNAFFMVGFPWESKEEIAATVSFMKELDPFHTFLSLSTPYPGTGLFEIYRREKLLPGEINWEKFFHQSSDMFLTNRYSREEVGVMIAEVEKVFDKHNRKNLLKLILVDPQYLLGTVRSNEFYKPKKLFGLIQYLLGQ